MKNSVLLFLMTITGATAQSDSQHPIWCGIGGVCAQDAKSKAPAEKTDASQNAVQNEAAQQALEQSLYASLMASGAPIEAQRLKFAALFRAAKGNPEATRKVQEAYDVAVATEVAKRNAKNRAEDLEAELRKIKLQRDCRIMLIQAHVDPSAYCGFTPSGDIILPPLRR